MSQISLLSNTNSGYIVEKSITSLGFVHNIILFAYHVITTPNKTAPIVIFSFISMIMMILFIAVAWANVVLEVHKYGISCRWELVIVIIAWICSKLSVYFFFLERLFKVFEYSYLEFESSFVWFSRITFICWCSLLITLTILYCDGTPSAVMPGICNAALPFWMNSVALIGDLIICLGISILFSRRMLLTNLRILQTNVSKDMDNDVIDVDIKRINNRTLTVISRSTLLTFIALASTELSIVFASIFGLDTLWISMDFAINAWCVLLIFVVHKKLFNCICGPLHRHISLGCLACWSCDCCCSIEKELNIKHGSLDIDCTDIQIHSDSSPKQSNILRT